MSDQEQGGPALSPEIQEWIRRIREHSATLPELESADLHARRRAQRELSDLLAVEFTEPIPAGVEIDDLETAGGSGPLRARRYRAASASGALPTMLWMHGGGWAGGTIDELLNDRLCADRALRSGVQIIALEYRLTPEHPFPAPVDDAVAALSDLRARADELAIDPGRLGIGGNSAGATIAATTALRQRDAGAPLHHQALEVLPAALRLFGESMRRSLGAAELESAERLADAYRAGAPLTQASPLDAQDHRGLAPALILAAEFDPLRDGATAYADALRDAGVPVVLRIGAGHDHASPGLTGRWKGAREWRDVFVDELAEAYRLTSRPPADPVTTTDAHA
ncbi:Carboxylesterase NlhH [Microbacterium oxydans]|uniref:alpha/beta hydrolase fold domain-containing protein n=1 Tax=Microbacterium oxydans TaxID=82380 RepID=UPI001D1C5F0F|nr:alpha/beta hydrolase fold domain-containing protein [Microbacterium oxydans]CAH0232755.1 Carboxylesterase NlhH [Microbacterium oxydans]